MPVESKPPKKILVITPQPFFQPRGSPLRVKHDVEALTELGYDVDVLAFPFGEDPAIDGVRVFRSWNPLSVRNVRIGPSLAKAFLDIFLFFRALSLTGSHRYDVIHCIEDAGIVGAAVVRFRRCRFIYEKHSDAAAYRGSLIRNLGLRFYERLESAVIRRADLIFAGKGLVDHIRTVDPAVRIQTVDNIPTSRVEPDPSRVEDVRRMIELDEDELLITYVGTFAPYQGIDLLLEAIPIVARQSPNVKFLIIGGQPGDIHESRKQLANQEGFDRAYFLTPIHPDETPHFLAASDILLSPRVAGRTIGTKLCDYARSARAIVATDHPSNRRMLDDSTGLLTPTTPEAFADGILRLVRDPVLRQRLADNIPKILEGRHDYDTFKGWIRTGYEMIDSADAGSGMGG